MLSSGASWAYTSEEGQASHFVAIIDATERQNK